MNIKLREVSFFYPLESNEKAATFISGKVLNLLKTRIYALVYEGIYADWLNELEKNLLKV